MVSIISDMQMHDKTVIERYLIELWTGCSSTDEDLNRYMRMEHNIRVHTDNNDANVISMSCTEDMVVLKDLFQFLRSLHLKQTYFHPFVSD